MISFNTIRNEFDIFSKISLGMLQIMLHVETPGIVYEDIG